MNCNRNAQRGSMLLEGLIGILIFSMGILALVGLQAVSIRNTAEAKYRADAAFLANQIISRMWTGDITVGGAALAGYAHNATTAGNCAFTGTAGSNVVKAWLGLTDEDGTALDTPPPGTVLNLLPGATSDLTQITVGTGNLVTVTICWQKPGETAPHKHVVVAQVAG